METVWCYEEANLADRVELARGRVVDLQWRVNDQSAICQSHDGCSARHDHRPRQSNFLLMGPHVVRNALQHGFPIC
jgi:hypothetical protein